MALDLNSLKITSNRESLFSRFWWNKTLTKLQALLQAALDNAGSTPEPGSTVLYKATLDLQQSDVADLSNTAVEVIPSPGAGKYINIISAFISGSTGLVDADGGRFALIYDEPTRIINGLHALRTTTSPLNVDPTYSDPLNKYFYRDSTASGPSIVFETGVVIKALSAVNPLTDSTGKVVVFYTIEDVPA